MINAPSGSSPSYRGANESVAPLPIRAHPLVFGVVLFLASELMFFAGMFAAYFNLRSIAVVWPPPDVHLNLIESSIGTAILAISSASMLFVTHELNAGRYRAARGGLALTICLGIAFLAIAVHGWTKNTFRIDSHAYGSLFYMMTGFHALHVFAGIVLLTGLLFGAGARAFAGDGRAGAEAITYYWHFVFIVWFGIWGTIYLLR